MNTALKRSGLVLALVAVCASLPAAADHGGFRGGGGGYSHGGYAGRGGWGGGYEGRGGWGGGYEGRGGWSGGYEGGGGWGWGLGWGAMGLGVGLGAAYLANPYVYSPYYGYPYGYPYGYATPTTVVIDNSTPVSPQGTTVAPLAQGSGSWFYCDSAKGYYPYVAQCPEPWRRVSATPPGAVQQ